MRQQFTALIGSLAFIAALAPVGYLVIGFAGILFSVAFVGGLVLWLLTTFRTPIDPQPIIMPYLVTVVLFIVHVSEECAAHGENYLARISG